MASLSYRREMDLIGPHGTSSISTRTAAKDPMSSFELAKLCESVLAQSEAERYERTETGWVLGPPRHGIYGEWLEAHGVPRAVADALVHRLLDGGFDEQG